MNLRKQRSGCVAGAVCIVAAFSTASAKPVFVSPTGNNTNSGLTWNTAKLTVQAGLNTAVSGDQVWVAAGTYVENITLKLGVALYGGFAGGETDLAQRDWTTNETILDGNRIGSVVTSPAGATSTTRIDGFTIRNGKGTGSGPRQNGGGICCSSSSPMIANNTISSNTTEGLGGGIFCSSSSAIIVNNLLTANTALSGGGIYCSSSSAMIVNNTIFANSGGGGGGISCVSSSPTIANTIVGFNSSGIYKTGSGTPTLRHNCVFGNSGYNYSGVTDPTGTEGNISVDPKLASVAYANAHIQPSSPCVGAGEDTMVQSGWRDMDGQARIIGPHVDIGADESDGTTWPEGPCVIVRVSPDGDDANDGSSWALAKQTVQAGINAAASLGGEIWVRAGTYCERITLHPSVHVYGGFDGTETTRSSRDWVANITVLDGQQGGSVVTILSGERISTIDGFTIRNGTGALLFGSSSCGGGICCVSSPTIENNVITSNAASIGGGIYCHNSSRPMIANTLIAGNSATYGGGIHCRDSSCPTIANNTIMGNAAHNGAGIECINSSPMIANTIIAFNASGIYRSGAGTPTLRYNCVYGNLAYDYSGVTDPTGTNGNISADPQLSCLPYGNGHIQPGSPCVDAGDDGVLQPGWTDMDGEARKAGAHVDIGADESDDTVWPVGPYTIVRVAPDGQDTNDGSSWALAKRTVQAGIDAAAELGGDVWVKAGTYPERITLHPFIHLYGGFNGTEASQDQRNFRSNVTILDGQQGGSVVTAAATGHRVATIDGFTIRNGKSSSGGGIYCPASSPRIANNRITFNTAQDGAGIYGSIFSPEIVNNLVAGNTASDHGGGIYCSGISAMIANNVIIGNAASYGGGIYSSSSSLIIANNTITGNAASAYGGGIHTLSATIVNTIIAFNSSGVYVAMLGAPVLRCNCVYGNGIYNYDGTGFTDPTGTNGNISVDPKLAASGGGHIQPDSPCVDAGDDSMVQAGWLDLDGEARMQGQHADIGADESDGTEPPSGPNVVVRVNLDGDDANDGSSWSLAKRTVQAGIDTAALMGGEVWVQAGIYYERITLLPHAHVYGGFNGSESARNQRDWSTNRTILDGQQSGPVVTIRSGGPGLGTIDGFTIQDGAGTPYGSIVYGGGIFCNGFSPTITNNTIMRNTASGSESGYGGGIYCRGSWATISNNFICGNTARNSGGAIYSLNSSLIMANNTITGNTALHGGGMACSESSDTIANTIVTFNSSGISGSASNLILRYNCVYGNAAENYSGVADPTGTNGNISADPGLAGRQYGRWHIRPSSPCADAGDDNVVDTGSVDLDGQARIQGLHVDIGADESDGMDPPTGPNVIVRVSPDGNDANDGASWALAKRTVQAGIDAVSVLGGDVWVKAAIYPEQITLRHFVHVYGGFGGTEDSRGQRDFRSNATILDGQQGGSVVTAQSAGHRICTIDGLVIRNGTGMVSESYRYGGGIYCSYSSPVITNSIIAGNSASSGGGGVFCRSSSPMISNSTISGNTAGRGGAIHCWWSCSPTITNNLITGNAGYEGAGLYLEFDSSAEITNTIIAFNSSGVSGEADTLTMRSNCVYGNFEYNYSGVTDPTGANGNISVDPGLVGWEYGRWRIQPGSPCVDAGDDSAVETDWVDLDGQARIQGLHVDIGADESDGTNPPVGPEVTVRVSIDGNDANDGSSWVTAKRTVQAGIDAAASLGGEVWVKAGTYAERIGLLPYAHVYGGFGGTEEARDQRDVRSNATILDGQQGGSVVTAEWTGHGISKIDGFTICNGSGTFISNTHCGGGIYCRISSPTIANNTIVRNTVLTNGCGAGIYCWFCSPTISGNTISGNTASSCGGGIYCHASSTMIVNNSITGNIASAGGGICCNYSPVPTIANTIVAFNSSGIRWSTSGTPTWQYNCVFGNTAYDYSGITDPTGTDGNISADPLFVRPASPGVDGQWGTADDDYGDSRLQPGSPCIDAGDNSAVPADISDLDGDGDMAEPIPFDLAGMARFIDDLLTPDTGLGTPPIVDMGAYEFVPVPALQLSVPADGQSLWRNQKNIIRLTFDADIAAPDTGAVMIQEMLAGGTYGDDLSAGFAFTVENDGQGQPRVLKIRETASSLQHRKWYAVRNTGDWADVAPFTVQYVVQVGDATNDGRVLNTDFGLVNAAIPTFSTADDDRRDMNGDGRILNTDFGVLNSKIPSFPVAKPSGH